jgi:UTP--glucose-1-phosphate uridylyltransferase
MMYTAIIPVAGLGTRLLPATKSQPKEMLPVARKPIVQYVVEELAANGIEQMVFITGRGKQAIENHFDYDPLLADALTVGQRHELLKEIDFAQLGVKIVYTRQPVQRGLGDAVLCGQAFARDRPFIVALGDSILGMHGKSRMVSELVRVYEERSADCVIAVQEVPLEKTSQYGIIDGVVDGDVYVVKSIVEKPSPTVAPSQLAVSARYAFSPQVFDFLREVQPDKKGEIQLTDAIQAMCAAGKKVYAVQLPPGERRYDIGNIPEYYRTFAEFALADPEFGPGLREFLQKKLDE